MENKYFLVVLIFKYIRVTVILFLIERIAPAPYAIFLLLVDGVFPLQNNHKNLDLSCTMDLDFRNSLG